MNLKHPTVVTLLLVRRMGAGLRRAAAAAVAQLPPLRWCLLLVTQLKEHRL
jgi:hypothetical protein